MFIIRQTEIGQDWVKNSQTQTKSEKNTVVEYEHDAHNHGLPGVNLRNGQNCKLAGVLEGIPRLA